ncbi:MAG TPA: hypothetical protein VMT00_10110 [Thermoanaerobaculia bacterium]|nr:hypothetical protein [Thermoanaerobaculia bacterium]
MRNRLMLLLFLILLVSTACRKEAELAPLSEYESADVQAQAYNFHVFPGSRFLQAQTELLRRAHFAMQPEATEAPPMAVYDTDASIEDVARFYASRYGYPQIAANEAANFSSIRPLAYYTSGDLATDAAAVKPILEKLGMESDVSKAVGPYRGAYVASQRNLPRVNIQRPYHDVFAGEIVDRTLILMVRE